MQGRYEKKELKKKLPLFVMMSHIWLIVRGCLSFSPSCKALGERFHLYLEGTLDPRKSLLEKRKDTTTSTP